MRLLRDIYLVGSGRNGLCLTDDYDCHVYLVDGGSEAALIDAGVGMGFEATLELIEADGIDPGKIKHLLLTHAHSDHAGGARAFYDKYRCKVYVSQEERESLEKGDEVAVGLDVAKRSGYYPQTYVFPACPVHQGLKNDDVIRVGRYALRAIATPGHSKGSVSFLCDTDDGRVLFTGDAIQFGDAGRFKGMISLLNAPGCSIEDYARMASRLDGLNVEALLPGHRLFCVRKGQRQLDFVVKCFGAMLLPQSVLQI